MNIQLLKAKLKYNNRTYKEVAVTLHMTRDTFARRIKSGNFTVKDVQGMMKSIPLNMQEVEEIFFKEKS